MTSQRILVLLVAVNLVSIGAAEVQRRALMNALYKAQADYTKTLDDKIESIKLGEKASSETISRLQKIQTDLERAAAQIVDIQGNARSSQTVSQEQRSLLPEIATRVNRMELLAQQIQAQLSELAAKASHKDATPSQ